MMVLQSLPTPSMESSPCYTKVALGFPRLGPKNQRLSTYPGIRLLIVGNCGKFGVQLAKLFVIGKIVVVGGDETQLMKWGATHILDRHGGHDTVLKRIRGIMGNPVIHAYKTVNPPADQTLGINALTSTKKVKISMPHLGLKSQRSEHYGERSWVRTRKCVWRSVCHAALSASF
ncbi:hypothetical protein K505DRAFT_333457 [Melanomma pulvis-pyrius CBS 109.77]|uniref:Alcohol dehydrogenase-like C-terminal domain-containing protein n=1 Tax=Melanomma pulvis-pyrius CBS 109.77 TaxID=1314802 RepID=A0A6A6XPH6_9PLEO|nr:hypothetical protein K505DRAFT_333457 [Melanomma pulvis-pyrius CBS 109.77]